MKKCIRAYRSLFICSLGFGIIYAGVTIATSLILRDVLDTAILGDFEKFKNILFFACGYLVFNAGIEYAYALLNTKLVNKLMKMYRREIFNGIFSRNFQDFGNSNTADYISALTNDIKMVEENYLLPLLDSIKYIFIFIATLIMLLILSPLVTFCLFISTAIMFVIPSMLGKTLQSKQNAVSKALLQLTTQIKDLLSGYEVIKTFSMQKHVNQLFSNQNTNVTEAKIEADRLLVLNQSLSTILGGLSQFIVIFVASYLIIQGEITAGTTLALIQLSGSFIIPVMTIMTNLPKVQGIQPILTKLDALSTIPPTSTFKVTEPTLRRDIVIEDVSFGYHEDKQVLHDISLKIKQGKKYAIVGKSGCGKSTLTKLMSGYYPNYQGSISFDGVELKNVKTDTLHQMISTIHQNIYMFDTSIENNITLYHQYQPEDLTKALQASGVDLFIADQSDGIQRLVGENGANLSGGQRQRIAVARALIKKTPLLVLDEGTSAIDKQTAYEIESKLLNIDDLTLLTITHNLGEELLSKYDEIIYMDEGTIVEQGTFHELMKQQAGFYNTYHITTS